MIRYDKQSSIGDAGVVYEFNVKLQRVEADLDNDRWDLEIEDEVENFSRTLRSRYKWIGRIYLTGRSNGWLAVEDERGTNRPDVRLKSLEIIGRMVEKARVAFRKRIESEYPRKHVTPKTRNRLKFDLRYSERGMEYQGHHVAMGGVVKLDATSEYKNGTRGG